MAQQYARSEGYGSDVDDRAGAPSTGVTASTGPGPYYISDTQHLPDGNLNFTDLPGRPIKISGHVYEGAGGKAAIPSARLEIWHADDSGHYHPPAPGDAAHFKPGELALRGYVTADAYGHYEFRSIYPGKYGGRCRHIHVRATAEGHVGVFSQLIVPALPGDDMGPEQDSVARMLPRENHLRFSENLQVLEAGFDFRLSAV